MEARNRVDPWGDIRSVPGTNLLIGNRGCLVDDHGAVVRRQRSRAWISCVLRYGGARQGLADPNTWTPLFFLDDAVALAAGHRPSALCRRPDYRAFKAATAAPSAIELDRRLHAERGSTWTAPAHDLPDGTVVVVGERVLLVRGDAVRPFTFAGWGAPERRPSGTVAVLTPPTSVDTLRSGFTPTLKD